MNEKKNKNPLNSKNINRFHYAFNGRSSIIYIKSNNRKYNPFVWVYLHRDSNLDRNPNEEKLYDHKVSNENWALLRMLDTVQPNDHRHSPLNKKYLFFVYVFMLSVLNIQCSVGEWGGIFFQLIHSAYLKTDWILFFGRFQEIWPNRISFFTFPTEWTTYNASVKKCLQFVFFDCCCCFVQSTKRHKNPYKITSIANYVTQIWSKDE